MMSGSAQLNDWIKRRFPDGASNEVVADYLGMDESLLTKLRKGKRNVGLKFAHKIERRCGIPMEAWLSDVSDKSKTRRTRKPRISKSDKASTVQAVG